MDHKRTIAPIIPHDIVGPWKLKEVRGHSAVIKGQWHEDGSEYEFTVPHQLVDCFLSLQAFATEMLEKERIENV